MTIKIKYHSSSAQIAAWKFKQSCSANVFTQVKSSALGVVPSSVISGLLALSVGQLTKSGF